MNVEDMIKTIYSKIESLVNSNNSDEKNEIIVETMKLMKELGREQVVELMADSDELVRNIAARVYVDEYFDQSLDFLCDLLNHDDENVRDSAVISICYMNTPENLKVLEKAVKDTSNFVKLRALTGIADIAIDYSNKQAKEILQNFLQSEDIVIREFVNDELSLMPA